MINPFKNHFQGPGDEDLKRLSGQNPQGSDSKPNSANDLLVKSKSRGVSSAGKKVLEDRERSAAEQVTQQDTPTPEMEKANTPGPDNTTVRPKATLKKVGWLGTVTRFNSDAEINAEFDVPASEQGRTRVDFQVLRLEKAGYKPYEKAQGHLDDTGHITVKVPIRKSEEQKSTFIIKVKHCTAEWSTGQGTEREVNETAEISFEHIQVSGLHFPRDKSFISDDNLNIFYELKKTYLDWKKSHEKAQIIVYGHSEADRDGDPHPISRNRAFSAFAFIIGDVDLWAELAEKERWGTWEQQCMLRALGFFKVKPTGHLGPITRQATEDFITFLNEARCKNFNPMLGFTEAYIRKELYREYINLKRTEIELPSSAFRLVSGYPYVGCSAFNRYRGGEELHDENRRVVFLIIQESPNFPLSFPCRNSTIGPCEEQCHQPGERATNGFRCKHYDLIVKQEKIGETFVSGNSHEIETHWKGRRGGLIPRQNDYNDDIYAAAKMHNIDPLVFKSLIAKESSFDIKANNDVGFAGLTQIGGAAIEEASLNIGVTSKATGTWIFDMKNDERFDSKKSIFAGALIFSIKRRNIDSTVFAKYKTQKSDSEKLKFYIASYNGGQGTVRKAWIEYGEVDCVWEDLIKGGWEHSALTKAFPKSWYAKNKYKEITEYVTIILDRIN